MLPASLLNKEYSHIIIYDVQSYSLHTIKNQEQVKHVCMKKSEEIKLT